MPDAMTFPDNWEDFINDYSFKDTEEIYTNGSELIPVFRVKQLIDHYFLFSDKFSYDCGKPLTNEMIEGLRRNQEELEKRVEKIAKELTEEKKRKIAELKAEIAFLRANGASIPTTMPPPRPVKYVPYCGMDGKIDFFSQDGDRLK